ncbi:MAG: hypothetical protein KDA32_00700 [Phycisphaerales bacterium]|nr:hypothetical protein [Phycisphaerales bacterium]
MRIVRTLALWLALSALARGQGDSAQESPAAPAMTAVEGSDLYKLERLFDFDEAKLGNYTTTPMHWNPIRGPGLPSFDVGELDFRVGHTAPPSFHLKLWRLNVIYEYAHVDLTVVPESDYLIKGHIRARDIENARAFLVVYFVNRFGEWIPGSDRVSNLVASTGRDAEPWQAVQVSAPNDYPDAFGLRIQVRVMQSQYWEPVDPTIPDPIVVRDAAADVWLDDLRVYRLPHARLGISSPSRIVNQGDHAALLVQVRNATSSPLQSEVSIEDRFGAVLRRQDLEAPSMLTTEGVAPAAAEQYRLVTMEETGVRPIEVPIPDLDPGAYVARLRVLSDGDVLLERSVAFAVIPRLPFEAASTVDMGIDFGRWRAANLGELADQIGALGVGAVKFGVPMDGTRRDGAEAEDLRRLSELVRVLAARRIESSITMLSPAGETPRALRDVLSQESNWPDMFRPIFALFGNLISTWQLGAESEMRSQASWDDTAVRSVRDVLTRFVTAPRILAPTYAEAPAGTTPSLWAPRDIASINLPWQFQDLATRDPAPWVRLESPAPDAGSAEDALIDQLRRITLTKALGAERIYVDAPLQWSNDSGLSAWEPATSFVPLRTFFAAMSGKRAVGVMTPQPDTLAILFKGAEGSVIVFWTWRPAPVRDSTGLYLGPDVQMIDAWGRPAPVDIRGGRTYLEFRPEPRILFAVQPETALLQSTFSVTPNTVQLHEPEPRPVLRFQNPYDTPLSGEMTLTPPANWRVEPSEASFTLAPGEVFERTLHFILPPKQIAQELSLGVDLRIHEPASDELTFATPVRIALREIRVETRADFTEQNDLIVYQTLHNLSEAPVNFSAYCAAPGRPREEREFRAVGPGEVSQTSYVFLGARDLRGALLQMGIREIRGKRSLDELVRAPE